MNLKKLLAENMLRYGVKNLSNTNKRNIQRLMEQVDTSAKSKEGFCIFQKTLVEKKLTPKEFNIEAEFYNNMVSLDNGLSSNNLAAIDAKIQEIVTACQSPLFNAKAFKVEINGQATSANPGMKGPKGVALDHPGGKPYAGLDISKEENKQTGNLYLAKQRAESIKAKLIAGLTAAGVNKRLPDLDKRIITTGKVVPGGAAAKGLRIFKVIVYVPEATQDPEFRVGSFATVNVSYEYTWVQAGSINDFATPGKEKSPWFPVFRSSWSVNFGVAGLGAGIDFSYVMGDQSGNPGDHSYFTQATGKHSGEGSGNWGFLGANGKVDGTIGGFASRQATPWISGYNGWNALGPNWKGVDSWSGTYQGGFSPETQGVTAQNVKANSARLINWLKSNGYITETQYSTIKNSGNGLILSALAKAGQSGFKKPQQLAKVNHVDLAANGGSNSEAKYQSFQATLSFDEFIQLCNGNTEPVLTKTTFPEACIYDLTAKDATGNTVPTLTVVKDMAADPGQLANVKRTI